jgi:hypothetical protein
MKYKGFDRYLSYLRTPIWRHTFVSGMTNQCSTVVDRRRECDQRSSQLQDAKSRHPSHIDRGNSWQ